MTRPGAFGRALLAGAALAVMTGAISDVFADDQRTALTGATMIRGDGSAGIANSVIIVRGERIVCAGTARECSVQDGDTVIDVTGKYVTPGLIDSHVHFNQTGWLDGRPDSGIGQGTHYDYAKLQIELEKDIDRWHRAWLCSGITAVFDVGGMPPTLGYAERSAGRTDRALVRAAGPLVTHADVADPMRRMFLPMSTDEEAIHSVRRLKEMGSRTVKVWYLKPPPERKAELDKRLMLIGRAARDMDMELIVHATELDGAKTALEAGARILVHSVQDQPVDREFLDLLTKKEAFYIPTLIVSRNWTRAVASVMFGVVPEVDDPNKCIDRKTLAVLKDAPSLTDSVPERRRNIMRMFRSLEHIGELRMVMRRNLKAVYDAGGRITVGTDSGNPLTMHGPSIYEEMEAMQAAGIPAPDIIRMATSQAAELLGPEYQIGTLEAGLLADLIVLTEDPQKDVAGFRSITHVMRAGVLHGVRAFGRD